MGLLKLAAALAFLALHCGAARAAPCIAEGVFGQPAQGRLTSGNFSDADGKPETALILVLDTPLCLRASSPENAVASARRIHIYATDGAIHKKLRSYVGKHVEVAGLPFAAHTAHHHAPIVMDVSSVVAR